MSVPVQHPMYIDGQFVTWRGDAWIDVVNPATEAVISRIPMVRPRMPVRQSMQQNVHNQNGKRCLQLNAPVGCAKSPPGSASAPVKSVR